MSVFEDIKTGLNQAIEYEQNAKRAEIIKTFEHFVSKQGEGVMLYNEDGSMIKLQDVVDLIAEQKAEIERLNDMKFTQEHCNLYEENEWLKVELKHQIGQNTELQKEVDELKKWLGMKEHYIGLIENRLKQSVKDTAKEMIEEIDNMQDIFPNNIDGHLKAEGWAMCIDELKEIAKERYGIEVE